VETIPLEILKEILYMLSLNDVYFFLHTNRCLSKLENDDCFWKNYLERNYDPLKYGIEKWTDAVFNNTLINCYNVTKWNLFLENLLNAKILDVTILNSELLKTKLLINVNEETSNIYDRVVVFLKANNLYLTNKCTVELSSKCGLEEIWKLNILKTLDGLDMVCESVLTQNGISGDITLGSINMKAYHAFEDIEEATITLNSGDRQS
jgi:hypothetical protein